VAAWLSGNAYQIILLGDRGSCVNYLPRVIIWKCTGTHLAAARSACEVPKSAGSLVEVVFLRCRATMLPPTTSVPNETQLRIPLAQILTTTYTTRLRQKKVPIIHGTLPRPRARMCSPVAMEQFWPGVLPNSPYQYHSLTYNKNQTHGYRPLSTITLHTQSLKFRSLVIMKIVFTKIAQDRADWRNLISTQRSTRDMLLTMSHQPIQLNLMCQAVLRNTSSYC